MDKLNVCLINDSFPPEIDGVANAVTNYADVITRSLGRATVVTPAHPQADDSSFSFPVLRYPSIDMTRLVGYRAGLPFSPEIQDQLVKGGFDIIHSHCPVTSTMLARALRSSLDVPLVMTYHTKFDIDISNAISSKLLQNEAKRLLVENISACDEIWTVSRGAGENLRSIGYEGSYIVMPNGVDLPVGRVDDALICEVTEGFDLPEGVPVFLFVGRMMWYKGLRIILDGLAALRESGEDFRMVFIGGGVEKDEIVAYSHSLGLGDRVFFVPPIHDRERIRAWYCRGDMFLFPSTFDTNGLVVREAAACGLGSVLVRGSCAAEDITDGRNGCLIDENADSMASMLLTLCRAPEEMARMGENAQRELYLSWDDSVRAAYDRYGAVIDNYRRGLYPVKEGPTADLFRSAGEIMDTVNRGRQWQRRRRSKLESDYNGLVTNIGELRSSLEEGITETRTELIHSVKQAEEKLIGRIEEMLSDRFL